MKNTDDDKEDSGISSMDEPELPPDGGWGWVVCFGSFMVNFILDGVMFSFGVMLLELLESFGETKSKTSMVGSALLGMSMMMGNIEFYLQSFIDNVFVMLFKDFFSPLLMYNKNTHPHTE